MIRPRLFIMLALGAALLALTGASTLFAASKTHTVALSTSCAQTGNETVATDKADYAPEQTVHITGTGYAASCDVVVKVTRPDGSVVKGDGSFEPGSDTVTTGPGGNLAYSYVLDGIEGEYLVEVLSAGEAVLATTTFTDALAFGQDDLDFSPAFVLKPTSSTAATQTFSVLVEQDSDTAIKCIRLQFPTGWTVNSATMSNVSAGTWNSAAISGVFAKFTVALLDGGLPGSVSGFARIEVNATTPTTDGSGTVAVQVSAFETNTTATAACASTVPLPVNNVNAAVIWDDAWPAAPVRTYTADFRDSGGATTTPSVPIGTSATYRIRMTLTGSFSVADDAMSYATIALPPCFASISVTSTTASAPVTKLWTGTVLDNVIRLKSNASGNELKDSTPDEYVQVVFTATAGGGPTACTPGSSVWTTAAWGNGSQRNSSSVTTRVFGITGTHPTMTLLGQGTLSVNKVLANAAGKTGNRAVTDFTFDVSGPTSSSGNTFSPNPKNLTVDPGSYTVTEVGTPVAGYTTTYSPNPCSSLTVTAGNTTTCTITNTFNGYPTTASTKVHDPDHNDVTNGLVPVGTKVHDKIFVSGRVNGLTFAGTNTVDFKLFSEDNCGVTSGAQIGSTETVNITDNGNGNDGTAESSEHQLAVGKYSFLASYSGNSSYLGSTATCEPFEMQQGTLKVDKVLANDPGKVGDKTVADFTFDVSGPTASTGNSFDAVGSPPPNGTKSLQVDPGSYTVTEVGVPVTGYTTTYSPNPCSSLTVTAGNTTTCTITNTFNGYPTTASTQVLDDEDNEITSPVPLGTKVHDKISVSGRRAGLVFDGNVDFKLFSGNNCGATSGAQIGSTETVAITDHGNGNDGTAESSEHQLAVGKYSFLGNYKGGSSYAGSTAACEPFEIDCPHCEAVTVDQDRNVTVDLNPATPTCNDGYLGARLCAYFTPDKTGLDPSQWKAIFDLGGKKLLIRDNVTVTVVNVPSSSSNQKAPGIVIKGCELTIEGDTDLNGTPGRVLVQSVNQQAGDILLEFEGNITINGTVRDEVTGTNGKPGKITIASCCGDVVTGPKSRIETIGISTTGGGDINILTCCDRGYQGAGGDIVINGLVLAQYKSGPASTINVVAEVGAVTIDGRNVFGLETVAGTQYNRTSGLLVHTFAGTDGGDITVQARDDVTVYGNTLLIANRVNFGAVAIKTNNTNAQGGNGTMEIRSLEGKIVASDRSFDFENRFNHASNTAINLNAKGDIDLSVTANKNVGAATNKKFVVSSQGGSGGQGGTNTLHSFSGDVIVGANVQVLANAPGGANGANVIRSASGPTIDGTAEILPAPVITNGSDSGPDALLSCQQLGVEFEHDFA